MKKTHLLALALCLSLTGTAFSKGFAPVATPQPGGFKFKFASNGQPVANYAPIAGGAMGASGVAGMTIAPGIFVEAAATGAITGFAAGGAWAAAIGALGAVAIAGIPAVKAWMDSAGVKVVNGSLTAPDPSAAGGYRYYGYARGYRINDAFFTSQAAVCDAVLQWFKPGYERDGLGTYNLLRCNLGVNGGAVQNVPKDTGIPGAEYAFDIYREVVPPTVKPDIVVSTSDAQARMALVFPPAAALQALLDRDFPAPVSDIQIVAPTAKYIGNTVMLGVDGSTISETTTGVFTSFGDNLYIDLRKDFKKVFPGGLSTDTKQVTTTNPDGTTQTQQVTTTTTTEPRTITGTYANPTPAAPQPISCGSPGTPPCKIDETGTPPPITDADYTKRLDKFDTDTATRLPKIGGTADKTFFDGWSSLFVVPALVACEPMVLPRSMGAINPCPVVDGVREVMAYMWALGALFLCLGMVREVI